jgi:tRNA (guanine-N7-)-methyltransferase
VRIPFDESEAVALDLAELFGRRAPVVVEIGSGMGDATARLAAADPDRDVLAVDVHTPGLGNLVKLVDAAGLCNVRVADGDAVVLLRAMLAPGSLDEVRAFFPDPWPKARHAKRRLVTPAFADLVASRLACGGRLHFATDWEPYAAAVRSVLAAHPAFVVVEDTATRSGARPVTRFERQALAAGRRVADIVAIRR